MVKISECKLKDDRDGYYEFGPLERRRETEWFCLLSEDKIVLKDWADSTSGDHRRDDLLISKPRFSEVWKHVRMEGRVLSGEEKSQYSGNHYYMVKRTYAPPSIGTKIEFDVKPKNPVCTKLGCMKTVAAKGVCGKHMFEPYEGGMQ